MRASYLGVGQGILSIDVTIVGLWLLWLLSYSDLDDHESSSIYSHTKDPVCGS